MGIQQIAILNTVYLVESQLIKVKISRVSDEQILLVL